MKAALALLLVVLALALVASLPASAPVSQPTCEPAPTGVVVLETPNADQAGTSFPFYRPTPATAPRTN